MTEQSKKLPEGFERVGVELPPSVIAIIRAAEGEHNMPRAMAMIIGAIPWIAVALHQSIDAESYAQFAKQLNDNIEIAKRIVNAQDPKAEYDRVVEEASRVN